MLIRWYFSDGWTWGRWEDLASDTSDALFQRHDQSRDGRVLKQRHFEVQGLRNEPSPNSTDYLALFVHKRFVSPACQREIGSRFESQSFVGTQWLVIGFPNFDLFHTTKRVGRFKQLVTPYHCARNIVKLIDFQEPLGCRCGSASFSVVFLRVYRYNTSNPNIDKYNS